MSVNPDLIKQIWREEGIALDYRKVIATILLLEQGVSLEEQKQEVDPSEIYDESHRISTRNAIDFVERNLTKLGIDLG